MSKILLLHGAIGSSQQLEPLAKLLSKAHDVYLLDFSGHGTKPLPTTKQFSIELFANNVLDWMNDNNVDCINILGYSMGGYVALYLAQQYPEKVERVFTFATKFEWNEQIAAKEVQMLSPTANMMLEMGKDNPLKPTQFTSIKQRVRLTIGDKDKMVTLEETLLTYRLLENASLQVFPNTAHPIEQVDVPMLAQAASDFFN